jgi:DNA replication and repair protein RecF
MPSLSHLWLQNFRRFTGAVFSPIPDAATVLTGPNGAGKTSVLEAIAFLGTCRSFRGASRDVMVRTGADHAVVRGALDATGRSVLVETEWFSTGRLRAQVNRQPVKSRRALAEAVPVSVFAPGDLALVQGGPGERRSFLDQGLAQRDAADAALVEEVERILRQRAALLRQARGLTPEIASSLDVWDDRLARSGTALVEARRRLLAELAEPVTNAFETLLGTGVRSRPDPTLLVLDYRTSWDGALLAALGARREEDLRRGVTTVGPHRDELAMSMAGRDVRTQASQGEQRCLAFALRLGVHQLMTARADGHAPLLLLDDVFSELDPERSRALIGQLPHGQSVISTAAPFPPGLEVGAVVDVATLASAADAEWETASEEVLRR